MPIKRTIKYEMLSFPVEVTLWSDVELARSLKIHVAELRRQIASGKSGLVHHFCEPIWKRRRRTIKQIGYRIGQALLSLPLVPSESVLQVRGFSRLACR